MEFGELDIFLRRKENWVEEFANPAVHLPAVPIGVPGVYLPSEMMGKRPSTSSTVSPQAKKKSEEETDAGDELSSFGLQDVKVSEQELLDLVKELGLKGDDANTLTKSLTPAEASSKFDNPKSQVEDRPSDEGTS